MRQSLTGKQLDLLLFMYEFFKENQQLPPHESICIWFGWASPNSAYEQIRCLIRKGYLMKNAVGKNKFTALALDCLSTAEVA